MCLWHFGDSTSPGDVGGCSAERDVSVLFTPRSAGFLFFFGKTLLLCSVTFRSSPPCMFFTPSFALVLERGRLTDRGGQMTTHVWAWANPSAASSSSSFFLPTQGRRWRERVKGAAPSPRGTNHSGRQAKHLSCPVLIKDLAVHFVVLLSDPPPYQNFYLGSNWYVVLTLEEQNQSITHK